MAIQKKTKKTIKKVSKALKKASGLHAAQAKTLDAIKMKKGGTPDNVKNPALYSQAKSKAKAKFDVYPSAYANAYMVKEYKKMGGQYKAEGGEMKKNLKPVPAGNKGLGKLPTKVRNNMGFFENGGTVMVQGRGCGAMMESKRKKTRVPRG
jgi:hypothetical protein